MRHSALMFYVLATTAYAVDSTIEDAAATVQAAANKPAAFALANSSKADICKMAVDGVGEAMPAGNYQGQCVNGRPDGMGQVIFSNGDRFSGEFKNGRIDGGGTWTSGMSGNTYTGNWRNGKRAGEGTYSWARGVQQYVGEWVDDKRQGRGTFTWANGDRFEGEFRNNRQYNGTYYTAGGKVHTCYMGLCR